MLQQLEIRNVALVERVSIEFGSGLNILTGETGAGKSIIIDSLQAILGERLSKDIIRTGTDKALVEAVVGIDDSRPRDVLKEFGIEPEEDGTIIISREFNLAGKNTCRINGKLVTLTALKEIGELLVDVHGQHDNQSLLRTDSHLELLDAFGGTRIKTLKNEYEILFEEYKKTKQKLKAYTGDDGEIERRVDLLKYQVSEIESAGLKPDEEDELIRKRTILANSEKIMAALTDAYDNLFTGGKGGKASIDSINEAVSDISSITRFDEKYESIAEKLREATYVLQDIAEEIRNERDANEYDPQELGLIEERLDLLYRLKKKYGGSIKSVIEYYENAVNELDEIGRSEENVRILNSELEKLERSLFSAAKKLHEARATAAEKLEGLIDSQLEDLEMKKAKFKVGIDFDNSDQPLSERHYGLNGMDRIEFLISPNAGEPLKSLSRIASGGEMARIMLAIKTILADVDRIPTLVFDEIDIGISGKASQRVGEKLSLVSRNHQVLCVTHLPQIACMADSHFQIRKESSGDRTETRVECLAGKAVENEIARILSGSEISDTTRKLAAEMLQSAEKFKREA